MVLGDSRLFNQMEQSSFLSVGTKLLVCSHSHPLMVASVGIALLLLQTLQAAFFQLPKLMLLVKCILFGLIANLNKVAAPKAVEQMPRPSAEVEPRTILLCRRQLMASTGRLCSSFPLI